MVAVSASSTGILMFSCGNYAKLYDIRTSPLSKLERILKRNLCLCFKNLKLVNLHWDT